MAAHIAIDGSSADDTYYPLELKTAPSTAGRRWQQAAAVSLASLAAAQGAASVKPTSGMLTTAGASYAAFGALTAAHTLREKAQKNERGVPLAIAQVAFGAALMTRGIQMANAKDTGTKVTAKF